MVKSRSKGTKTGQVVLITVLVLAVIVLSVFAVSNTQLGSKGEVDQNVISSCDSTTTPSLTIDTYDKENIGTAVTEGTNLYRQKGKTQWNNFTAGTSFEVSPGQILEVVMGITTTDFTDNAYGQHIEELVVPCEENPSFEFAVANDEIETSLTATFYNNDGDAGAETFVAGQTQDVSIKLQAGVDEYFGNPYLPSATPNVICLDLNTTTWDKPEKVSVKDGAELSTAGTPQRHSAVAGKIAYCYEMPVIGEDTVEIVIKANADDTNAPAVDDTAYMYAGNWYINAETGALEFGVENEEGTAVGTDASDSVTLDWTA